MSFFPLEISGLTFWEGLASGRRQDGASAVAYRGAMWITKRGTKVIMVILVVFLRTKLSTVFFVLIVLLDPTGAGR